MKMVLVMLMGVLTTMTPVKEPVREYQRAMIIDSYIKETDEVICVDACGLEWAFYGKEDLEIGDLIICTMSDAGTKETIFDDEIVDVTWSGYYFEGNEFKSIGER